MLLKQGMGNEVFDDYAGLMFELTLTPTVRVS